MFMSMISPILYLQFGYWMEDAYDIVVSNKKERNKRKRDKKNRKSKRGEDLSAKTIVISSEAGNGQVLLIK